MSKGGGAGKVYFVLYLAVVLELLIIIVERDEAEEGLQKKQKETMRIVESILSQLQSGAGTEGINTRPQDEITLFDKGSVEALGPNGKNIKSNRKYIVEVGVTDVSTDLQRKENEPDKEYGERLYKLAKLANVQEIEYQIFYHPATENIPFFYTEDSLKRKGINMNNLEPDVSKIPGPDGSEWTFLSSRKLTLDNDATNNKIQFSGKSVPIDELDPIYKPVVVKSNGLYAPPGMSSDSVFFYSSERTKDKLVSVGGRNLMKRAFEVNFQPPDRDGWYKLRFVSQTNRILGVKAEAKVDELGENTTVNIGTVQLTVKDLNKVKKELQTKLEKYNLPTYESLVADGDVDKFDMKLDEALRNASSENEGADEIKSKIKLFGYIAKLLAPGQSVNFSQNKGSIEFNIKVNKLQPQTINPKILLDDDVNMVFFDVIKPYFKFSILPYKDATSINGIELQLKTDDGRVITVNKNDISPIGTSAAGGAGQAGAGQKADFIAKINDFIEGGVGQPRFVRIFGKYNANGKTDTASGTMMIFKTGMNDENDLRERLNNEASIGNYMDPEMLLQPNSGGKIRNDRFQILFSLNNEQSNPIDGLKIPFNGFYFPEGAKNATFKIFWKKPLNNEPIEIFAHSMNVTIAKPKLSGNPKADARGPENDIVVKIGEIVVQRPPSGKPNEYLETAVSGSATVSGTSLKVRGNPTFSPIGNVSPSDRVVKYNVTLRLAGELDPEKTEFRGKINLSVTASSTTKSGEKTPSVNKTYNIDFRHRPDIGD